MLLGAIAAVSAVAAVLICMATGSFAGLTWLWLLPVLILGFVLLGILLAFLFLLILTSVVDLNKEQKEALKKFAEACGDNNYEERKKFFKKFKK